MIVKSIIFLSSLCLVVSTLSGQKVTVSPDINIRTDVAFHILGRVDDQIMLYRDQGTERKVLLYDDNLVLKSERQVNLKDKRANIYDLVNLDTAFSIFYGYRDDDDHIIQMDVFSPTAELIDSLEIFRAERSRNGLQYESIISEDHSKVALYNMNNDDVIGLIIIDTKEQKILLNQEYLLNTGDIYDNFVEVALSNEGSFLILTEFDNYKGSKESHQARIYNFLKSGEGVEEILIPLKDILTADIHLSIDNRNHRVGVAGLYDEKKFNESAGYFWVDGNIDNWQSANIHFIAFDELIFFELYGERSRKKIEDFVVKEVIWKNNGSPIIIFEMSLDVSRRSGGVGNALSTRAANDFNNFGGYSGWSDHYREDILVISLNKDYQKEWHQIFYKKQFSQNDQGIYSSVFPFITPSRTRLLFNDEIKSNSTVSEYIFDGIGNFKRTSVLSTEYQNLRLRFQDALQISNAEVLVPSQKSYTLNLVKVDYTP